MDHKKLIIQKVKIFLRRGIVKAYILKVRIACPIREKLMTSVGQFIEFDPTSLSERVQEIVSNTFLGTNQRQIGEIILKTVFEHTISDPLPDVPRKQFPVTFLGSDQRQIDETIFKTVFENKIPDTSPNVSRKQFPIHFWGPIRNKLAKSY